MDIPTELNGTLSLEWGKTLYVLTPIDRAHWANIPNGSVVFLHVILEDEPEEPFPCVVVENRMTHPENTGFLLRFTPPNKARPKDVKLTALAAGITKLHLGEILASGN